MSMGPRLHQRKPHEDFGATNLRPTATRLSAEFPLDFSPLFSGRRCRPPLGFVMCRRRASPAYPSSIAVKPPKENETCVELRVCVRCAALRSDFVQQHPNSDQQPQPHKTRLCERRGLEKPSGTRPPPQPEMTSEALRKRPSAASGVRPDRVIS